MADETKNVKIKASLEVDTGNSAEKLSDVKKGLKGAGDEAATGTGTFSNLKNELKGMPGPAAEVTSGFSGLNKVFDLIKSNPIILVLSLVVAVVVKLYEHLSKMKVFTDNVGPAFSAMGDIIDKVANVILKPLIAVVKAVAGALEWMGNKLSDIFSGPLPPGFADKMKAGADSVFSLEKHLRQLEEAQKSNTIAQATANRKLQEAREASLDTELSIKDRIKALQLAAKIEKEELDKTVAVNTDTVKTKMLLIADELGARQELIDKIKEGTVESLKAGREELLGMEEVDKEKVNALNDQIIAAEDAGAKSAKIQTRTHRQINTLQKQDDKAAEDAAKERAAKIKEASDKADAARKARIANLRAFEAQELKLHQQIELNTISDAKEKELTTLYNAYNSEAIALKLQLEEKKLTQEQYYKVRHDQLLLFLSGQSAIQKKFDDEEQKKLDEHQKKINEDLKKQMAEDIKADNSLRLKKIDFQLGLAKEEFSLTRNLLDAKAKELKRQHDFEILEAKGHAVKRKEIEEKYNEDLQGITKAREQIGEAEMLHKKAMLDETSGLVGKAAEIFGQQTVAGKTLSIAQALINTYTGATEALRAKSTLPSPFDVAAKIVNVAAVLATGFKAVKSITAVNVPGAGAGAAIDTTIPAPLQPQQQSTNINAASIQGIGNAAAGGVGRAFVLDVDVSNNAERTRRINRAARLG